ncbi:MAG: replicative DNA helicase [Lachnospiraceae bacterium]|nr:replicative DNA helicase [Lachnospiraceae bacterium]
MEEALIKKVQPHSKEAEQAVIGSMIMDRDALLTASELLQGEDFYIQQYGILFDAMVELLHEGKPAELVTILNKLKEKGVSPEICGMEFIRDVTDAVSTSANIKYYADIVAEKALSRKLIKITEGIANTCYTDKEQMDTILEETEKQVFNIVQKRSAGEYEDMRQVVLRTLKNIEAAAKSQGRITGIATGFRDLDYKLSGLQKQALIVLAARPAMGKTAFVLNMAEYISMHSKVPTVIFSLEMGKESLVNRLLAMNSRVDSQSILTGDLKDSEWADLMESARNIGESSLIIDDTPGISLSEMRSKCRKLKLEKGLGLIIIDYLQLMTTTGRVESRQQEISNISRSLKGLARELDVPVIALSQLSRAVEQRPDKRPMMSDLRESGAIEQDADVVMFIYRDEYYNPDTEEPGITEIIIGKHRAGPTGTIKLKWMGDIQKFGNLEARSQ